MRSASSATDAMINPETTSSTALVVTWNQACTTTAYLMTSKTALAAPIPSSASASGISTLIGLKYMTMRSTWRMYRYASRTKWNFEVPARLAYSIGTYSTGRWLDRNDIVIVVTQLNPGGSRRRYGRETSRRNARRPEFRSGILVPESDS